MAAADLAIVGLYMAAMVLLSAWLARGQAQSTDYYLGGRSLPWWALGLSTLATQSSANSFIGIPAFVALVPGGGLTWLQYELALPLAMLLVMLLFVPVFRGLGLVSIYEYLEQRFDRATRLLLSAVFLASRALASGVALYAAAVVIQVCTGLPLGACVLVLGLVTVVYDMLGGLRAVVWTEVLQMLLLTLGVGVAIGFALHSAGGVQAVLDAVEPARLAASTPATVWVTAQPRHCGALSSAASCSTWPIAAWTRARCSASWPRPACRRPRSCCSSTAWRACR